MDPMVMLQIIVESAITLVRILHVDLLNSLGQLFILGSSAAWLAGNPLVVSRTSHMKQLTGNLNGAVYFFTVLLDCNVDMALPYL